jgi:hypothetical protein
MKNKPTPRNLNLSFVAWVSAAGCLYAPFPLLIWYNITETLAGPPSQIWDSHHLLPQAFFAMFWFSGEELFRHFAALHGVLIAPSPWLIHTLHVPLVVYQPFHLTWLYPPVMGLLAMLYACLPLPISFWVWRGLYFLIGAALLRRAGLGWRAIILGLASPAAIIDLSEGENGMLTGGLAAASLLLMEQAPRPAGLISAFLSLKPQTGAMLPFVLLQRRLRPALASAAITGALLVLATLPFFGVQGWLWFLLRSPHASADLVST